MSSVRTERYSEQNNSRHRSEYRSRSSHKAASSRSSEKSRNEPYSRKNSGEHDRNERNNDENRFSRKNTFDNKSNARSTDQVSPLKRRNNGDQASSHPTESPSKRARESSVKCVRPFNLSNLASPSKKTRSSSLVDAKKGGNKPHNFSTPKSERRANASNLQAKIREMQEQNSIAMERNLSKNWADILEELEEQSKEVDLYIEKVSAKYSIDVERLRNNMETDPQVLRKRQKCINYGKVTAEYQRYSLELPRKKREPYHPRTPNKFRKVSRRKFDGAVKKWRKLLHAYDEDPEQMADMKNSIETMSDYDNTNDFGGESAVGSGISGYNIDDFDILDSDPEEKLAIDAPMEAL